MSHQSRSAILALFSMPLIWSLPVQAGQIVHMPRHGAPKAGAVLHHKPMGPQVHRGVDQHRPMPRVGFVEAARPVQQPVVRPVAPVVVGIPVGVRGEPRRRVLFGGVEGEYRNTAYPLSYAPVPAQPVAVASASQGFAPVYFEPVQVQRPYAPPAIYIIGEASRKHMGKPVYLKRGVRTDTELPFDPQVVWLKRNGQPVAQDHSRHETHARHAHHHGRHVRKAIEK